MKKSTLIWIILLVIVVILIAGCSVQSGTPPPTGPIGGGCS